MTFRVQNQGLTSWFHPDLTLHMLQVWKRPEQAKTSDKKSGHKHTRISSSVMRTEKTDNDCEEKNSFSS